LKSLIDKANQQSKTMEEQLAQATMQNTLKTAVESAIESYIPGQNPDFICQQIVRLQELGDVDSASEFSRRLGEKIAKEADNLIVNEPAKAIELFNAAQKTCPAMPGLATKIKLAEESLESLKLSEEAKKQRDLLAGEIAGEIAAIKPPAAIDNITERIRTLASYPDSAGIVEKHKDALFQKYFNSVSGILDKSPETARAIVDICISLKPGAPGLSEVAEKIRQKILEEEQAKAARAKEELAQQQEKAVKEVLAQIKKARLPNDITGIQEKIAALPEELRNSGQVDKLRQQLYNRCRNDLKDLETRNAEKALTLLLEMKSKFTADESFASELQTLEPELQKKASQAKIEAEALAKADAENKAREEENARQKEAEEARIKAENEAKAKAAEKAAAIAAAEEQKRLQTEAAEKARLEEEARQKAESAKNITVGPAGSYQTISDAIKAAPDGATIKIAAGTYNEQLIISRNVVIEGETAARCTLSFSQGATVIISSKCKISGLTLNNTGNKSAATILVNAGDPEISNCVISNSTPAIAPDFVAAIHINNGSARLLQNQITGSRGMGINVHGGSPLIRANTITGCDYYCIWLRGSSSAKIQQNTIKSCKKSGIGVKAGAAPEFIDNTVSGNGENGILVYAGGSGKYENNRISDNKVAGIDVWNAQPDLINNNTITNNKKDGIYIRGKSSTVRLGKNQFSGNKGNEIRNSEGRITQY
jgi:parallel beta-helix repeat protein